LDTLAGEEGEHNRKAQELARSRDEPKTAGEMEGTEAGSRSPREGSLPPAGMKEIYLQTEGGKRNRS